MELFKSFLTEDDGIGTVEVVIILAVMVGVAIIFRKAILKFSTSIMTAFFNDANSAMVSPVTDADAKKVLDIAGATPTPTTAPATGS